MTNLNREEELLVAERAAEWLNRLKTGTARDRAEFWNWLKESRLHVREVLLATSWDSILDDLDPDHRVDIEELIAKSSTNVVAALPRSSSSAKMVADVQPRRRPRWPWFMSFGAVALTLAVIVLGWPGLMMNFAQKQFETAIGEQRAFDLPDGSVIHLNTKSRVRVAYSAEARDVYLDEGEGIFKVKRDPARPFRVHAGLAVVQAIGTQFNVDRRGDRTEVAVIEGLVQVMPHASDDRSTPALAELSELTRIAAGEAVSVIADGHITPPAPIDIAEVSAWQQRRLVFRRETLEEIAEAFNRYNRALQIRVEGDALRAKRFSGVFDADDPESLLTYLATDDRLVFAREGDELVIRLRPEANPAVQTL